MKGSVKNRTQDMVYIALFSVVIAVCAWIVIPMAIPFTLQTFAVFLTVAVLGGKRGVLAVLLYLLLGAIGIPVFSGFTGGIGILLGHTGGFIMGFLLAALFMWAAERLFGRKSVVLAVSMLIGLLICYVFGSLWYRMVYAPDAEGGMKAVLATCVLPFVLPDLLKIALVFPVRKRIKKAIKID